MQQTTITLGGRTYPITAKTMKGNREWRKLVMGPLKDVADAVLAARTLSLGSDLQASLPNLATLFGSVASLAVGSMDLLMDALFEYDETLKANRDAIELTATDEEGIQAFTEVLKLAYPLGSLLSVLRTSPAVSGSSTPAT